jgi:hypothetical protein
VPGPDTHRLGIELLAHLEHKDLSIKAALDRIELVTTVPAKQREILDAAVEAGVIERTDGIIRPRSSRTYVTFEQDVTVREGDFSCERCGTGINEGHFVEFDAGELGPFGSTCIRKVLGRV